MPSPLDYISMMTQPNFAGNFGAGLQVGNALHDRFKVRPQEEADAAAARQLQLDAARAKIDRQEAYRADLAKILTSPTGAGYRELLLKYPEQHEALKTGWEGYNAERKERNLGDATATYGLISSGNVDGALKRLRDRKAGLAAGGEETAETDALIRMLESGDPSQIAQAKGLAGLVIASATGDKAAETIATLGKEDRENSLFPAQRRQAEAQASTAETAAEFAPAERAVNVEATRAQIANIGSQIEERANRLSLDRDRLETDTALRLDQMDLSRVGPAAQQQVNQLVLSAASNQSLADRASSLADDFAKLPKGTGAGSFSGFNEFLKDRFGNQNALTMLRNQYTQVIQQQALKNLPPGPASDKDVQMAQKGFPTANADRDAITSFLRGMAKLQSLAANADQARADWVAENGSLGRLKRDANINGVRVPAGSNWMDFAKSDAAYRAKTQAVAPTRQRYGL